MMPRRKATAVRVADSEAAWPRRLVTAHFDTARKILTCGFEGGDMLRLPLRLLGIRARPSIVYAAPDEFGSGVVFFREDGSQEDCGADLAMRLASYGPKAAEENLDARDLALRVAGRLLDFRKRLGISKRAMALRLGMAAPNYHRLETGRHIPTPETLMRIAGLIGVSLARLVSAAS